VASGKVMSTDLSDGMVVTTVQGATATVGISGGTVTIQGPGFAGATVTTADVVCSNGVIHIIEAVMIPPNIVQVAVAAGSFNTLAAALTQANLVDTLTGPGPFTVFAPTDAAFAALLTALDATAEQLLAREDLSAILTYHVASGKVMSGDLSDGMAVTTVQGSTLTVGISGGTVTIGDATVTAADIVASNGVIHVIDKVLLPPAPSSEDSDASGALRAQVMPMLFGLMFLFFISSPAL
jgi:transforming growth factor-beta-induced protein